MPPSSSPSSSSPSSASSSSSSLSSSSSSSSDDDSPVLVVAPEKPATPPNKRRNSRRSTGSSISSISSQNTPSSSAATHGSEGRRSSIGTPQQVKAAQQKSSASTPRKASSTSIVEQLGGSRPSRPSRPSSGRSNKSSKVKLKDEETGDDGGSTASGSSSSSSSRLGRRSDARLASRSSSDLGLGLGPKRVRRVKSSAQGLVASADVLPERKKSPSARRRGQHRRRDSTSSANSSSSDFMPRGGGGGDDDGTDALSKSRKAVPAPDSAEAQLLQFTKFARSLMLAGDIEEADAIPAFLAAYRVYIEPTKLMDVWLRAFHHAEKHPERQGRLIGFLTRWMTHRVSDLAARDLHRVLEAIGPAPKPAEFPNIANDIKLVILRKSRSRAPSKSMALAPRPGTGSPAKKTAKGLVAKNLGSPSKLKAEKSSPLRSPMRHRHKLQNVVDDTLGADAQDFLRHISVRELAEGLTVIDWQLFCDVPQHEFVSATWKPTGDSAAPSLARVAERLNTVAFWVTTRIIFAEKKHRREVLELFVELATELRHMRNYQGMMAVVLGLNHLSVLRLKALHSSLSSGASSQLEKLEEFMDLGSNYAKYRRALKKANSESSWTLPYVGLQLSDLEFVRAGNEPWIGKIVNVHLLFLIYEKVKELAAYQDFKGPGIPPDSKNAAQHLGTLQFKSDDELQEASYKIEANRGTFIQPADAESGSESDTEPGSAEPDDGSSESAGDVERLVDQRVGATGPAWLVEWSAAQAHRFLRQQTADSFVLRKDAEGSHFVSCFSASDGKLDDIPVADANGEFTAGELLTTSESCTDIEALGERIMSSYSWVAPTVAPFYFELDRNHAVMLLEEAARDGFLLRPCSKAHTITLTKFESKSNTCEHFHVTTDKSAGVAIRHCADDKSVYTSLEELVARSPALDGFSCPRQKDVKSKFQLTRARSKSNFLQDESVQRALTIRSRALSTKVQAILDDASDDEEDSS